MSELQEYYSTKEEAVAALAEYNEGRPEKEQKAYIYMYDSYQRKRMYIICELEYFYWYRNQEREERRKRDIESRCVVPSAHFGLKKCMEDCNNCPYGKLKRDGAPLSLDYMYTNKDGEEFEIEIEDESLSVDEQNEQDERMEFVRQLLDELKGIDKQIIDLFLDGKKDREIGEILNINVNTIKTKRTRIIQKLKIKIEEYF